MLKGARVLPAILVALLIIALVVPLLGQPYYTKLVARMAIFALAAVALDLVVGYAGLASFGHAAFFGIGAYVAGVLPFGGVTSVFAILPLAALLAGTAGVVTGALSLRSSGLYFIFITLAFAQMFYYIATGLKMLHGVDGFRLPSPTMLPFDTALARPVVIAYFAIVALIVVSYFAWRVTRSHFGRVVVAARDNERKLAAVGLSPFPYRLALYAISAGLTGVAGALFANLTEFVSPQNLSWILSGEMLFMVILGSAGTIIGPILGAIVFVGLEQWLSAVTEHWQLVLGIILVLRVLYLRTGLYGLLGGR